jgi:alpha-glucosidase (family GH31 glycosyl hydrolase)
MMQFSLSPWRVLDGEHLAAVLAAVDLHQALVPEIIALARHAARTGEPILRPLAYAHRGYEDVTDQFLLGSDLLCAPVLARDAGSRHVVVPPGRWRGADGHVTEGPAEVEVAVTLASVPLWRREHAG